MLLIGISYILLGCSVGNDNCFSEIVEDYPVTFNTDCICGCDGVTYVNHVEAECYQIYTYVEGKFE